jgi:hypothetical protein
VKITEGYNNNQLSNEVPQIRVTDNYFSFTKQGFTERTNYKILLPYKIHLLAINERYINV